MKYHLYTLKAQTAPATSETVLCKNFLRLSSFLTKITGVVVVSECRGNLGTLVRLVSTWYLQQGSNCQEIAYTPAQITLRKPNGMYTSARWGHTPAQSNDPMPDRTAVLWRQLPQVIHLAASSPSFVGSTTIVLIPASRALSSSTSNSSCEDSCSYISLMIM